MTSTSSAVRGGESAPKNASSFESVALLLQGGGALGAYQAGVYEALHETGIVPDWIGGISMGAVNGAIIAGNKPADRIAKLRDFGDSLTEVPHQLLLDMLTPFVRRGGDTARTVWDQVSSTSAMVSGVPGFFEPRMPPAWISAPGSFAATSFYDTREFKKTLEQFIDFNILNDAAIRYTTSAVNVRSGNYSVFDSRAQKIGPEHVMASGALPPGLPAIEIDGQDYWDGGLISNTPLQWVMDDSSKNTLIFQVDLWSAQGDFPKDIASVMTRQKEIQYSSRTRAITDHFRRTQKLRHAFVKLYEQLTESLKKTKETEILMAACDDNHLYNIVHLIYRARGYEGYSKDCEFSQLSRRDHWKAGYDDTMHSLRHKEILQLPRCEDGIKIYDLTRD